MSGLRAGDLNRRIKIQESVESVPPGHSESVWSDLFTVWASKLDITGRERVSGVSEISKISSVFRIRWKSGIKPEHRLIVDGIVHDIEYLAELGKREILEITTSSTGKSE